VRTQRTGNRDLSFKVYSKNCAISTVPQMAFRATSNDVRQKIMLSQNFVGYCNKF